MKFIKDSRLFGMLNIVDIMIILTILVIILPMLHYYIKFNEKGLVEERLLNSYIKQQQRSAIGYQKGPQISDVEVYVSFKSIKKEDLDKIKVHDKEILSDGTIIAEVLWVGKPVLNYFIIDLADGVLTRTLPDPSLYSLPVRLKLKGIVEDQGRFSYKAKELKIHSFHIFNPGIYEVNFVAEVQSFVCGAAG